MKKVITYGTYDLLHYGHLRLLERAKELGDYLIVGVTADDFDISRGKINVQQSLMERIEAVRSTGLADEIIIEEYEGQKIDDIKNLGVDIFTVGSDWTGKFDYLKEYCEVVYLKRTKGVSSSELRTKERELRIGLVGEEIIVKKFATECQYVNGVTLSGVWTFNKDILADKLDGYQPIESFESLVDQSDALYIASHPSKHYEQIKYALERKKHVLFESPIALSFQQGAELYDLASANSCVLYEGIKTAYSTAYARMILLAKTGKIGEIISVDATCTSLKTLDFQNKKQMAHEWNSLTAWGPTTMLPIFQLLGTSFQSKHILSRIVPDTDNYDEFSKISFVYPRAVASMKVGKGVKSEGELIISGTKGYIYVPAPWWKSDYFEIRYENPADNKRYFYQLDGEGIRYEVASFVKSISNQHIAFISKDISLCIAQIMEDYENAIDLTKI